ncbi:hypothetical protein HDU96_005896 [Phlyctochytrium bullatum]|nr:hypothetical protein HDU96_005896 [Phlyctochytrium bullatum]
MATPLMLLPLHHPPRPTTTLLRPSSLRPSLLLRSTRSHATSSAHGGSILPRLPAFQIFAANTDVGKTIFSAALCRGANLALGRLDAARSNPLGRQPGVFYVKPVQTGYPADSDARFVKTHAPATRAKVLFTYSDPLSPHVSAIIENRVISDADLVSAIRSELYAAHDVAVSENLNAMMWIETAGGVHSPAPSGISQSRVYRPLRLPTVLVGDANLGGISTTMTSHDSLLLQGYDVPLVLLFEGPDPRYGNAAAVKDSLQRHLYHHLPRAEIAPRVFTIPNPPARPPEKLGDHDRRMLDATNLMVYFSSPAVQDTMAEACEHLLAWHEARIQRLEHLEHKAKDVVWWPFTQHQTVAATTVIDSAHGDHFSCYRSDTGASTDLFDACASWWTQTLGHGNPDLALAAARAAGRYGHVMFPECAHEPAVALSEQLLRTAGRSAAGGEKQWAERVFFSDDGSTAIEVGLKMAFRRAEVLRKEKGVENWKEGGVRGVEVVGIEGGYHGDTIGAMNACNPNVYNERVEWYKPQGLWFAPPSVVLKDSKYHVRLPDWLTSAEPTLKSTDLTFSTLDAVLSEPGRATTPLPSLYHRAISQTLDAALSTSRRFGALLLEPLLMGAGGMVLIDPAFQRALVDACRERGIPVVFDEVFAGLYRLGADASVGVGVLRRDPDVACFAKSLTGGVVPMAVTMAGPEVFEGFRDQKKVEALLHGHSYTAHPVGCAVALESLRTYESGIGARRLMWDPEIVNEISNLPAVDGVVSMGTVLAVELKAEQKGYASTSVSVKVCQRLRERRRTFARPLGNVVYVMGSLTTPASEAKRVAEGLLEELKAL